jgi:AraC-like DNA-binding protein
LPHPTNSVALCLPVPAIVRRRDHSAKRSARYDRKRRSGVVGFACRIRDRCLRSGGRALAVSVSDAGGGAPWEPSCRRGARRIDCSRGAGLIASRFVRSVAWEAGCLKDRHSTLFSWVTIDLVAAALSADEPVSYLRRLGGPRRTWERACDYAERHLGDENLSPARIADAVGISTRYLSELFASQGTTTMEWVARRRLESCRAALERQSWAPGIITEIAFQSGFGNISSFNRSLRKHSGLPRGKSCVARLRASRYDEPALTDNLCRRILRRSLARIRRLGFCSRWQLSSDLLT